MRERKYSHWRKQLTDIQGERKRVDIRIKKSGLKFIHSKVFSSGRIRGLKNLIKKVENPREKEIFLAKILYEPPSTR